MIHSTAIVSELAQVGADVEIGPFSIVEADVVLGDRTKLAGHVTIKSGTTLGADNTVCEGAVLGGFAQHANRPPNSGRVMIGSRNIIREHSTVHRAIQADQTTTIGDDCMLMVGAHVAHDCRVGNRVILTNGVMLGGHVEVGDRACLGGNAAVHQHCRIGRLAMVGGCTKVVQDLPPFVLTDGATALIVGLNKVGLQRAGFSREEVLELKAAYRLIYREGLTFREMVSALEGRFPVGVAAEFAEFFRVGTRGFVQERRSPPKFALRVHPAVDEEETDKPAIKAFPHAA
ncbi:acyl-ACP--UDP-N-acetylglucosamine O-acyltransferase [Bythopirellula polymerisocia]|uniref:Acyl-[acyl-carrier-protein]--UDP-N-acetylglucosamine O-acyltransferase n=1 Tax=Bythopirellula polymerisocia TaxID=2528003 RepID=A0A5C6CYK9_9BACT|nr:acyl-ACP--UDP-N-acetylglucosamine O-acyltransferase [Bythopirellula polymerisocia]TWU29478.1 Acyl-[acyl-carrier-protein]--UDP-N-acetylglucosamine O-acyltransferase [Bythopirellula polymerisocia]